MLRFNNFIFCPSLLDSFVLSFRCVHGNNECIAVDVKDIEQQKSVKISFHDCNIEDNFVVVVQGLDHVDEVMASDIPLQLLNYIL